MCNCICHIFDHVHQGSPCSCMKPKRVDFDYSLTTSELKKLAESISEEERQQFINGDF